MANTIKIMDPHLALKIAAGEVVERPASVVKELIENSLDAGATEVSIYVTEGGRREIRVVDNGAGLSMEDARLAFERHATSKLKSEDDLIGIMTMGFRGEALPSIASIARVTLKSRRKGDVSGVLVEVEGGGDVTSRAEGCPDGTSVEVRDLFFNTPARLKFLRTPSTEFGHILELVKRLALASPEVRFNLTHGSTKALDTPGGTLGERLVDIFGKDVAKGLIETGIGRAAVGEGASGFISRPELSYPTMKHVFTYVNGRFVRERTITRALIDGYLGMLDKGRYPFAVINVTVPPGEVDVNVHPAKTEVRFSRPSGVFEVVRGAVSQAISGAGVFKGGAVGADAGPPGSGGRAAPWGGYPGRGAAPSLREAGTGWPSGTSARAAGGEPGELDRGGSDARADLGGATEPVFTETWTDIGDMEVIGQLFGEFLLTQSQGAFFIIDQHAAAERVRFERLKALYKGAQSGKAPKGPEKINGQYLLVPERVETTPSEAEALRGAMGFLGSLGFEIIEFGPSQKEGGETFIIKATPEMLGGQKTAGLIKELAEELEDSGGSSVLEEKIDSVLMTIACHSVIRGPRTLDKEEARALLKDMAEVDFSAHCPHGRPVVKSFTRVELDRVFKRS